jgi:hypothetical protein
VLRAAVRNLHAPSVSTHPSGKDDLQSPHSDAIADLFTDLHFLEAKAEAQA